MRRAAVCDEDILCDEVRVPSCLKGTFKYSLFTRADTHGESASLYLCICKDLRCYIHVATPDPNPEEQTPPQHTHRC